MIRIIRLFILSCTGAALVLPNLSLTAQTPVETIRQHLEYDIYRLASDSMLGRGSGTSDERRAAAYICKVFQDAGLKPAGEEQNSYYQTFRVNNYSFDACRFSIDGISFEAGNDFGALASSGDGRLEFEEFLDLKQMPGENVELQGKVVMLDLRSILGNSDETSKYTSLITAIVNRGAKALLLHHANKKVFELALFNPDSIPALQVPALYLTGKVADQLRAGGKHLCKIAVSVSRKGKETSNILGFLDFGAAETVVIGGHYDHVGYKLKGGDTVIFNGADDNASGTAGVLELARLLSGSGPGHYNYLFIAFGSEEAGLLGSQHFCKSELIRKYRIAWMLNMDMIGRLGWNGRDKLTLMGYGSSGDWRKLFRAVPCKTMKLVKIKGAPGYSDHFPFLNRRIPLIYFTTGLHHDYHKPQDDPATINFEGQAEIISYITDLIKYQDHEKVPVFHRVSGWNQTMAFIRLFLIR